MALANAACQLAIKHGKNVICVDWDLEAPGLHQYFSFSDEELAERPGLLDYLEDFVAEVKKGSKGKTPELKAYLQDLKPEQKQAIKFGSVRLMHCGRTDSRYMARVERFNWDEFYEQRNGYEIIETLKKQLRAEADMTLLDARAGQADIGVVPTIQIPDALVILFTSNRQSLSGMERMARSFHHHPQRVAQGLRDPRMLLVPSRVFPEEDKFQDWMDDVAGPVYGALVADGIVSQEDQPGRLWQCVLEVDPKYSIDETLVVTDASRAKSPLKESYVVFARALDNLYYGREEIWPIAPAEVAGADVASDKSRGEHQDEEYARKLRADLGEATRRGDRGRVAYIQGELGRIALDEGRLDEAETILQSALAYAQDGGDISAEMFYAWRLGNVAFRQGQLERALELYRRFLQIASEQNDKYWQVAALNEVAKVLAAQKRGPDAWEHFTRALAIAEDHLGVPCQAVVLFNMATLRHNDGQYEEAIGFYQRALKGVRACGYSRWARLTLHHIAQAYSKIGGLPKARNVLEQTLEAANKDRDKEFARAVRAELSELESRAAES
jgi:tetratricopeptide (TPR) repeat protein